MTTDTPPTIRAGTPWRNMLTGTRATVESVEGNLLWYRVEGDKHLYPHTIKQWLAKWQPTRFLWAEKPDSDEGGE